MTSRVVEALATRAVPVRVLALDEVRSQLAPGRRVSETDREILHRALAYATSSCNDFTGDDDQAGGDQGFARDAALRILRENGVENGV